MNKEEIFKALEVIKKVCSEQNRYCGDCPFYSTNNGCNIMNDCPNNWKIQGKSEKWRAFYD